MSRTNTNPRSSGNLLKMFFDWFLRRPESGIILILLVFVTIATIVNPTFLSPKNIINILRACVLPTQRPQLCGWRWF